jgi:hypothetical protein
MAVGGVLMAGGLAIRAGALGAIGGPAGSPAPTATASTPVAGAAGTSAEPGVVSLGDPSPGADQPSPEPSRELSTESSPEPGQLIFADDFDVEAAWPTGMLGDIEARYVAGAYVLAGPPIDLPVFIAPVADTPPPEGRLVIEVLLDLTPPGARAGAFVSDEQGTRWAVLGGSDGRVIVARDTVESLDVVAAGSVAAMGGSSRLEVTVDGEGLAVTVDGRAVVSLAAALQPVEFGLAVWPVADGAVRVDRFSVSARPGP